MSFADDMARLLSLSVVKGEELLELADLWAGGGHASEAFVHVILGEMATVEKMMNFLAEHLQDHLQDSVVGAAGRVALWQLKMHVEGCTSFPMLLLLCLLSVSMNAHWKETVKVRLSLRSAYHTFQEALRIQQV